MSPGQGSTGNKVVQSVAAAKLVAQGKRLVEERGCLGCHQLDGHTEHQPIGPVLSYFGEKRVERLPFADGWQGPRTRAAWTQQKLAQPRTGLPNLMMPSFSLEPGDLQALTIATLALRHPAPAARWAAPLQDPVLMYPAGKAGRIMRDLKCLTCHRLGKSGGSLAPDLSLAGSRLQPDWLRDFLRVPYAVRPNLVERMPRFGLSDDEVEALARYIEVACQTDGLPNVELSQESAARGAALFEQLRCRGCHILGEKGGSIGPNLSDVGSRLRPEWIAWQLIDPKAAGAKEPNLGLSKKHAQELSAFLATQRLPPINKR